MSSVKILSLFFFKHIRVSLSICATFNLPCQASILPRRKLMKSNMMFDSRLMQVYICQWQHSLPMSITKPCVFLVSLSKLPGFNMMFALSFKQTLHDATESERYLQTSDFGLHTSKFRLQISESLFPDFLRLWFLHFHTKQLENWMPSSQPYLPQPHPNLLP